MATEQKIIPQDTLEEAADRWGRKNYPLVDIPRKGITPFGSKAFKAGACWMAERAKRIEFGDWIDVKVSLPPVLEGDECSERVLIYWSKQGLGKYSNREIAYYDHKNKCWRDENDKDMEKIASQDMWWITHWQPLPSEPKL